MYRGTTLISAEANKPMHPLHQNNGFSPEHFSDHCLPNANSEGEFP